MNIEKSITTYLKWKRSHTTVAYERYQIRLNQFKDYLKSRGKNNLIDIDGDDVVDFHEKMESQNYSPATIAYSARILKNFFWFWHGRGKTHFNPKEIIPVRYTNADKDIIDEDDFEIINSLLGIESLQDIQKKLVINLLWDTGMRISELLDIKLAHINDQGQNGLRSAKVRTRKSMKYNHVVWGKETNELLNIYLGIRLGFDTDHDELLINPKTKKPFTQRSVQRWMKLLCEDANIDKNYTPHSFRHGKANSILEQGGNMRDVSVILRHVKPESSFAYTHLCANRHQELAGKYMSRKGGQQSEVSNLNQNKPTLTLDSSLLEALKLRDVLLQAS